MNTKDAATAARVEPIVSQSLNDATELAIKQVALGELSVNEARQMRGLSDLPVVESVGYLNS